MSVDDSRSRTAAPAWGRDEQYPASEAASRLIGDEMVPHDTGRPLFGTRLGLRRAYQSDGRFVVEGRLRGRRIG
jgi:hypothetical protein